jgi:hypothetical protein
MTNHTYDETWNYLENLDNPDQNSSGQQMIFDPSTGEFKVSNRGEPIPEGSTVIDPSTQKGFWFA